MKVKEQNLEMVMEMVGAIVGNEQITPELIDEIIYQLSLERKKVAVRIARRKKKEEENAKREAQE